MDKREKFFIQRVTKDCEAKPFQCGNGSIENRIKGMYYASILREGAGYEIISNRDGIKTTIGYYLIRIQLLDNPDSEQAEDFHSEAYNQGTRFHYGAVEISFLAIQKNRQGEGIGTTVLASIIKGIMQQSDLPIRFILIEALKEKLDWYVQNGFMPIESEKNGRPTIRMYMDCIEDGILEQYIEGVI